MKWDGGALSKNGFAGYRLDGCSSSSLMAESPEASWKTKNYLQLESKVIHWWGGGGERGIH